MTKIDKWIRSPGFYLSLFLIALSLGCLNPGKSLSLKYLEDHAFYIIAAELFLGLAFFVFNRSRLMLVSFACCATLCYTLNERTKPSLRPDAPPQEMESLRIAHIVLPSNREIRDSVLNTVAGINADLVSIQNIESGMCASVQDYLGKNGYRFYHFSNAGSRMTELAVFSRRPFDYVRSLYLGPVSNILGKIIFEVQGEPRELHFMSTYMEPPSSPQVYEQTLDELMLLAVQSKHIRTPLLAFGRYNLVSWSRDLVDFHQAAGLQSCRRGVMPFSSRGGLSSLEIPFDHIFYSEQLKCVSFETIGQGLNPTFGIVGVFQFVPSESKINVRRTSQEF
jgi:hypothetical protein